MTHPQMIRPSAFVPDEPEDDETGCAAGDCRAVADGSVPCQLDADMLCADHLSEHISRCPRCQSE